MTWSTIRKGAWGSDSEESVESVGLGGAVRGAEVGLGSNGSEGFNEEEGWVGGTGGRRGVRQVGQAVFR